ncbi:hypothetical protein OF83DRAFT_307950 [Amylostereum chailletii]|nr:hypothetical protein OF83DRAFT_307950 [Amylostereum chailletii]
MVCENARGWKRYQDYVLEHSDRWLALSERRGLGLRMEDIILVTGRDLTASWANIVFASAERGITSELHVDFTSGAPRRVSGIRWTNAQSVVVQSNWGPSSMASELDEPLNTAVDQCLFIRYISAKPRRLFLHKQLLTNRLPLVPTSPPAEHHTVWSVRHSRGTKSSRKGPEQTTGLASAEFTREDYEAGGALAFSTVTRRRWRQATVQADPRPRCHLLLLSRPTAFQERHPTMTTTSSQRSPSIQVT